MTFFDTLFKNFNKCVLKCGKIGILNTKLTGKTY